MSMNEVVSSGSDEDSPGRAPEQSLPYARPVHHDIAQIDGPLTRFAATVVAVRIAGIIFLVQTVMMCGYLIGVAYSWFQGGWNVNLAASVSLLIDASPIAVYGLASFFLLKRAERIAGWILPTGTEVVNVPGAAPAVSELQAAAFAVAGIMLFVWALPEAMSAIWWRLSYSAGSDFVDGTRYGAPDWITFSLQAGLGIALFLGSKGLSSLWRRLRHPEMTHTAGRDA